LDNKIIIVPGLRYDLWRTRGFDYNSQLNPPAFNNYDWETNTYLSPKLGIRYDPLGGLIIIRANYGEGFRVGTLDDRFGSYASSGEIYLGSNDLDPEISKTVDLGFELNPLENFSVSLTGYFTWAKNYIDSVEIDPTPYLPAYSVAYMKQNIGRVEIKGIEGSLNYSPLEYLSFFMNGNITRATITEGEYKGYRIPRTPETSSSLGADFSHPDLFNLRISGNWTGRTWSDSLNTPRLAEGNFWLFSARISKKFEFEEFTYEPFVELTNLTTREEIRFSNASRIPINLAYAGFQLDF
jgi:outer membrane receptor protein involved in Fe transport